MEFKTINFEDDAEFEEMLSKMHTIQLNSTLLESPSSAKCGLSSIAGSPCSPQYIKSPQFKGVRRKQCLRNSAMKALCFSQNQSDQEEEDDYNNSLAEIDLNKTYSSKTMDHKQLSLMLAALEDDDDE